MATLAGTLVQTSNTSSSPLEHPMHIGTEVKLSSQAPIAWLMRAQDQGRAAGSNYTVWVSSSPDFAGAGYAAGTPTPTGAMVAGSVVATRID